MVYWIYFVIQQVLLIPKIVEQCHKLCFIQYLICRSLRHPNMLQLIGVVLGDTIRLVTEFMGKGNLVEYLRSRGRSVIQKKDQIDFAT